MRIPQGVRRPAVVFVLTLTTLAIASARLSAQETAVSPVADALAKADAAIEKIVAIPDAERTFENTLGAVDAMIVHLRLDTEFLQFMAYVSPDAALRQKGTQAEEDVRNWLIGLTKREDLYKAVKAYADTKPKLKGEQDRLIKRSLRDYRRAGMDLSAEDREKLKGLEIEINKLSLEFEKNIREDETRVPLREEELKGMSEDYLKAQPKVAGLYMIGMDYPSFLPIQDYCEVEATRKKTWVAYKRRGGKKNIDLLERILKLRAQAAGLLNYQHPADYETEVRMAKNAENVLAFYKKLRPLARKKAELDYAEFVEAKRRHTGEKDAKLEPWDFSFYEKRLMKEKYAVDSEKVSEYFPIDRVIDGLFEITQSLYGLKYRDVTKQADELGRGTWHPDVRFFEVTDKDSGEVIGHFYIDLHPRPNKYGHAAQWGLYPRKAWPDGSVQKPLAALVCNFTKPTESKPSLLTHDEVETFFHEFGHCLHSILTEADYAEFSGTAVARDFVEAPSQMFENWVWDARVLNLFAQHYQTGEKFPEKLLEGMLDARYLGSGMKTERQIYYGMTDMTYHTKPDGVVDTTKVALELADECEMYDAVEGTYFQASFGHLMGYQAGYYGYLWSLVYAQDMFQRFKELGMLSPEAGQYYREKILSRGGTIDEMEMVKNYLGREPSFEPFLKHLGLEAESE